MRYRPPSLPIRRQLLRSAARHSRDRACVGRDPLDGGVPPPGPQRRARPDRDAALHRFQLLLRPDASLAPEHVFVSLFWRQPCRLRLLFAMPVPRGIAAGEAPGVLALAGLRVSGQPIPALPPVLGALPVLRREGKSDGVRIRGDQVSWLYRLADAVRDRGRRRFWPADLASGRR